MSLGSCYAAGAQQVNHRAPAPLLACSQVQYSSVFRRPLRRKLPRRALPPRPPRGARRGF